MTPKEISETFAQVEQGLTSLVHAATHPDAAKRYGISEKDLNRAARFLMRTSCRFEDFHDELNKLAQTSTSENMLTFLRGPDKGGG